MLTMVQLPEILARITPAEREVMQRNVVFAYEQFFSSLSHQVHTGKLQYFTHTA
jgi:hypothetical protein